MPSPTDFRRAFGLEPGARIGTPPSGKLGKRGTSSSPSQETSFELVSVKTGHEALSPNERYAFPTTLLLLAPAERAPARRSSSRSARDAAEAALRHALRDRHIVYSAYGSPYDCAFDLRTLQLHPAEAEMHDGDDDNAHAAASAHSAAAPPSVTWRATCRGLAVRRRDVPTKAQAAAQGDTDDTAKEKRKRVRADAKARGLRVVTSRFGSGVCASCGAAISHGQLIARPTSADAAGTRGGWAHAACALQQRRAPRRRRA